MTALGEVVGSRELLWNLTLRELRAKYKRSVLGWALVAGQPAGHEALFTRRVRGGAAGRAAHAAIRAGSTCSRSACSAACCRGTSSPARCPAGWRAGRQRQPDQEGVVPAGDAGRRRRSGPMSFAGRAGRARRGAHDRRQHGTAVAPCPALVVVIVLLVLFVLGIALALSVLQRLLPGPEYFLAIVLQVWFYATPIVYPARCASGSPRRPVFAAVPALNPMTRSSSAYRNLLYDLRWPAGRLGGQLAAARRSRVVHRRLVFRRLPPGWPRSCERPSRPCAVEDCRSGSGSTTSATRR